MGWDGVNNIFINYQSFRRGKHKLRLDHLRPFKVVIKSKDLIFKVNLNQNGIVPCLFCNLP